MKNLLLFCLALFALACHNTNPNQGSGGVEVDKKITLSSKSIVDSAKSIMDQSFTLEKKASDGEISQDELLQKKAALMVHYKILFNSLSSKDTLTLSNYKEQKEQEILSSSVNKDSN